jgi:hypothetical protein
MKFIMRIFFVLVPAILVGAIGSLADWGMESPPFIGPIGFLFMLLLGWEITTPRPERGEE